MTARPEGSRARRVARRALAVFLGILLPLALLEAGLQIAHVLQVRAESRNLRSHPAGERPLVAFVGDSNVYGLYVRPEETLPKALERLSTAGGGGGLATVNLGVPSAPSWVVAKQLERALELGPVAVVVRCGINNFSSVPPGEGWGFLEGLRIVKLARILAFNARYRNAQAFSTDQGVGGVTLPNAGMAIPNDPRKAFQIAARDGGDSSFEVVREEGKYGFRDVRPRLQRDYKEMADRARAKGVQLFLLGYLAGADGGFSDVRDLMRLFDKYEGLRFVDPAPVVARAVGIGGGASRPAEWHYEDVHALRSQILTCDRHPTALGYEVEARVLANALAEAGIAATLPREDPVEFLRAHPTPVPGLERAKGDALAFVYAGDPNDRITLVFGVKGTSFCDGLDLPFDIEPVRKAMPRKADAGLIAAADGAGRATVVVPETVRRALKGNYFAAAMVQRGGRGGAARVLLSRVVEVTR